MLRRGFLRERFVCAALLRGYCFLAVLHAVSFASSGFFASAGGRVALCRMFVRNVFSFFSGTRVTSLTAYVLNI